MAYKGPKLRDDLVLKRQVMAGEVTYLIKNRETSEYLRFREMEWAIISRLNGENSYQDIADAFSEQFPDVDIDAGQIEDFVDTLKKKELIVRSPAERSIVILEKLQAKRKKQAEQSQAKDIFYLTLATTNPQKFYSAIYPWLRWIWTPPFVVSTLLYFCAAATVIVSNWAAVREGMLKFWNFQEKTSADVVLLFLILAFVIAIHESAHALTCMNFGGEVTEMGFMLIFFAPAFYANVSDAYLFDKKWHKYWVTLAGGYSELCICSTAVFTWWLTAPDTLAHHVAYNVMVFAGVSTIIFNYNPLIKLDGYYLLSDILEMSNLRENSAAYISYLLRKKVYRVAATPPPGLTPRKKRIWTVYGLLSTVYIVFIVTLFVLFVFRTSMRNFPEMGIFLGTFLAYMILKKRIQKLMTFSRFVFLDKRELLTQKASIRRWGLATAVLLLVVLFYPFGNTVSAPVVLEPARQLPLRAEAPGFVAGVAVNPDGLQAAGEVLVRLRNPEIVARRENAEGEVERLRSAVARAQAAGDVSGSQSSQRELESAAKDLSEWQRQEALLVIRAPFDGYILTARLQDLKGQFVKPGDLLCNFGMLQTMRARIRVNEFLLRDIADNREVRLKLNSFPGDTFRGSISSRGMAADDSYNAANRTAELVRSAVVLGTKSEPGAFSHFHVFAEIPNRDGRLRAGMSGMVKIRADSRSIAGRVFRSAKDLFRSKVWW
ncbi:MAG: PqqD family peptide modification chaperone [Acidobacteria bacterium]|nr:PqqD family peptide modification chaperone [Acidobacteriota bacterium]MCL5287977.1 PqqD family peptide modification chaperone [Acidobacteriota bacterium]